MLKHKAKLAQLVLANGGVAPEGVDCTLLQSYADARGIELKAVSENIVSTIYSMELILIESEKERDKFSSLIDEVREFRSIYNIEKMLSTL